jgi:hypothetical protein
MTAFFSKWRSQKSIVRSQEESRVRSQRSRMGSQVDSGVGSQDKGLKSQEPFYALRRNQKAILRLENESENHSMPSMPSWVPKDL